MAVTITREMLNSRSASDGGTTVAGLFIRDVDDFIPYIERDDYPLSKRIKTGGSSNKLKYEHGQGYLGSDRVNLTEAIVSTSADTMTVDSPNLLQQYDVVRFPGGELVQVTDASPANPVTITREYGGTTAETVADDAELIVVGPAVPEGVDTPSSPSTQGDLDWDTFQILEYSWSLTNRSKHTPTYEFQGDRFKSELKKKMTEAARDLENIAIYGVRYMPANVTDGTMTRGAIAALTENGTDLNADPWDLRTFLDNQQAVFTDVGPSKMGHDIILAPFQKRAFNSFFNGTRRSTVKDAKMNMTWDEFDTDFGTYRTVVHYNWPTDRVAILNLRDIKRMTYEGSGWQTGMLATQGWYDRGFLRGDFGFIWPVARYRSHLYDLSTNANDYPKMDVVDQNAV